MDLIVDILLLLIRVAFYIIIAQAILSWLIAFNVIDRSNQIVGQIWAGLEQITEPVYRPVRNILPPMSGLDFTPMVVLLGLYILQMIIVRVATGG